MKKIVITVILPIVALFMIATGVILGTKPWEKAKAYELTVSGELKENYSLDDWFDVPDGVIVADGSEIPAESAVKLPDGKVTREKGFFLDVAGKYEIIYTATVNGKTYVKSAEFVVTQTSAVKKAKITVDLKGYSLSALPVAEVGKPYKLFDATAVVGKTVVEVVKDVYFVYGEEYGLKTEITEDTFTPERVGTYEIRYTAKNLFGDETKTVIKVNAVNDATELAITPSVSVSGTAGEKITLGAPEVALDSRTGKPNLTVKAIFADFEEIVYDGEYQSGKSYEYLPERVGEWQIEWTLADYSRTVTATSSATVVAPDASFDAETGGVSLEPVFLVGRTYKIPDVYVKSYDENGLTKESSDITVTYNDGTAVETDGNVFTVNSETATSVTVKWAKGELEKSVTVPVDRLIKEDGSIDTSALFYVKTDRLEVGENGVIMDFSKNKDVKFANKLHVSAFSSILDVSGMTSGKAFEMTFTDPCDANVKLTLKFSFVGAGVRVTNKLDSSSVSVQGVNGKLSELIVSYANKTKTVTISNGESDGSAKMTFDTFAGFTSDEALLSFTTTSTGAKLVIMRVNAQKMNNISKDTNAPELTVNGAYLPEITVGEETEIYSAYATDVLDGYCKATVSVKDYATGEFLTATDGTVLNGADASVAYKIKANKKMRIRIQYLATDTSKREAPEVMYINAVSGEKPVLTVGEVTQTVAKRGDKLVLPEISVTHPLGEKTEICVAVFDSDGKGQIVGNSGYTFEKKGTHKIVITVYDEEGNSSEYYYYTEVA